MSVISIEIRKFTIPNYYLNADDFDDETSLFSSSLLDSFSMLEVIGFLGKRIGRRMKPTEVNLDNLNSVQRIVACVAAKLASS